MKMMLLVSGLVPTVLLVGLLTAKGDDGHPPGARHEQLRIAAQQICPVSGEKLGSHGDAIKVTVGKQKEEVYLCCSDCAKGQLNANHWKTIHSNLAKAQGKCPVMQKKLPANPKWTIANGQIVYICCPPCSNKIAKDPGTYLNRVDGYYAAALR